MDKDSRLNPSMNETGYIKAKELVHLDGTSCKWCGERIKCPDCSTRRFIREQLAARRGLYVKMNVSSRETYMAVKNKNQGECNQVERSLFPNSSALFPSFRMLIAMFTKIELVS